MDVSEAVLSRASVRSFKTTKVSSQLIKKILKKAFRSPSGGNLQPWKIYIVNGNSMNKFLKFVKEWKDPEAPAYDIYPPKLKEPYRTYRYELGEQMYSLLNIPREDKEGRLNQVLKNFEFFGAPCGLFCFIDKTMGPPQWSDLGMFLQTFMLLAREEGLDTCAQEAWSIKHSSVSEFLKVDQDHILFCGMAIGYKDENSPINNLKSERKPFDQAVKFI
jgi:nitroreductase